MKGQACFDAILQELLQATKKAAADQESFDKSRLEISDLKRSNAMLTDRVRGLDERLKEEEKKIEGIHQLLVDLRPYLPETDGPSPELFARIDKMISDTDEIPF